jgi:hypothetical protein
MAGIKGAIAWLAWDFLVVAPLVMVVPKAVSMHLSFKACFVLCLLWEIVGMMWKNYLKNNKKTNDNNSANTSAITTDNGTGRRTTRLSSWSMCNKHINQQQSLQMVKLE